MAQVELCNITKKYKDIVALDDVSLTIKDNEFFVLFGPAGAGKSTLLKTIAGIEMPQQGLVKFDGEIMNHVEPKDRNVSMVFENYALYPNLTVYDNIAFPLRSKLYKQSEEQIKIMVERVAAMMHIDRLLERKPSQLSNGQRQRVALGRCLVRNPNIFLMDEPLAHLDAKLRHLMRGELKEMQSSINSTTLYVTHDYMEAMSLADRIAVLNQGKIVQIGTAQEMYYTPCNEFVAALFGEPEINLVNCVVLRDGDELAFRMNGQEVLLRPAPDVKEALREYGRETIDIGIRGIDIQFAFQAPDDTWMKGLVYANEPIGNKVIMTVQSGESHISITCPNDTQADLDQVVYFKPNMMNAIYFDCDTKTFLARNNIGRYTSTAK